MSDTAIKFDLNETDISNIIQIIDLAADNGGFKGWHNIRQVLAVRDRLNAALLQAQAQEAQKLAEKSGDLVGEPQAPTA